MNHFKKVIEIPPENRFPAQGKPDNMPFESTYVLSKLAEATITPVIVCTTDHKITWVNEAFTKMTGYTFQEAIGSFQAALVSGIENYDVEFSKICKKLKEGSSYRLQFLCKTKYDQHFWNDLYIQPIVDEEGNTIRYFVTYRDITEKVNLEEALMQEQEEKERKVTEQVILAQERERTLISRELHDDVSQVLTAVKLQLETAREKSSTDKNILERSIGFLNNSITEIRKLSQMLSAPTLGSASLADCIRDACNEIAKQHRLEINLDAGTYSKRLPTDKELFIYRIFQDQFDNIIKHAAATKVQIALLQNKNQVRFSIKDNGKGFNANEARNGLGINNISSRVKVLRGKLDIITAPGKGCKMEVVFTI